jgi:hypothetical protein
MTRSATWLCTVAQDVARNTSTNRPTNRAAHVLSLALHALPAMLEASATHLAVINQGFSARLQMYFGGCSRLQNGQTDAGLGCWVCMVISGAPV